MTYYIPQKEFDESTVGFPVTRSSNSKNTTFRVMKELGPYVVGDIIIADGNKVACIWSPRGAKPSGCTVYIGSKSNNFKSLYDKLKGDS